MSTRTLALSIAVALATRVLFAFSPPRAPLPVKQEFITEHLENMNLERLQLAAEPAIQMDFPEGLTITEPNVDESFALRDQFRSESRMSLAIYPGSAVAGSINRETVTDYMERLVEAGKASKDPVEIRALPGPDGGKTRIRFLGAKPVVVEYAIRRLLNGEPATIIVLEGWAQLEGKIYRWRIAAPETDFESFFSRCRGLAGTAYFLD